MEKVIKDAHKIAVRALKRCQGKDGMYAALNHFKNYWARDAFFASFGLTYLKEYKIVKKQLLFFIKYQKKSGHIPRMILKNPLLRVIFINLERTFDTPFISPFLSYFSRDQNSLFVICAWQYIKKSKDREFAEMYFDNFERALNWNFKFDTDKDLILEQGACADWEDSIRKKDESLFTNLCSYKALVCFTKIANYIGMKVKKKQFLQLSEIVKKQINKKFWTGHFFTDSIDKDEKPKELETPIFPGASNMLAIYWGVANKTQSKKILTYIKDHNLEHFTIEVNYPNYPESRVHFLFRLLGMKDYHNGMAWLWIGCVGVLAYRTVGNKRKAQHLIKKLARKIVEYGEVYEVYEPSGVPVNRFFWKSAYPFAWSAGMFVYAIEKMKRWG